MSMTIPSSTPSTSANNMAIQTMLTPNQTAPSSTSTYQAQAGDTLQSIAQRFGVSPSDLQRANPQLSSHKTCGSDEVCIRAGDKINLPASMQKMHNPASSSKSTVSSENGTVTIDTGDGNDDVKASLNENTGEVTIEINGQKHTYSAEDAKNITIRTNGGNDRVEIDPNMQIPVTVEGGNGDDFIQGGAGNDHLDGGAGNDEISGGKGRDMLVPGGGNDTIRTDDYDQVGPGQAGGTTTPSPGGQAAAPAETPAQPPAQAAPAPFNGQQPTQPPATKPTEAPQDMGAGADPAKVDEAVKQIKKKLDESKVLDEVTHKDLNDIKGIFQDLSPAEAQAVYERLKADGKLEKFLDEMNSNAGKKFGGLNKEEKFELFNTLANKLDGKQLDDLASRMSPEDAEQLDKLRMSQGQPQTTDMATRVIERDLKKTDLLGNVKESSLKEIKEVFKDLSPEQAKEVYARLKADGKLDDLIEGLQQDPVIRTGGLSDDEKVDFFKVLVQKLSPEDLADFATRLNDDDKKLLQKAQK